MLHIWLLQWSDEFEIQMLPKQVFVTRSYLYGSFVDWIFWLVDSFYFDAIFFSKNTTVFTGHQHNLLSRPCISYSRVVHLSHAGTDTESERCKLGSQKSSPTDSPRTLILAIKTSSRNLKGFTPSEGIKWEWGRKNSQFSANKSPYLRNGARSKLLLMANRKSHMPFRLVPKSTTLDDLEQSICTVLQKRCVFWSPPQKFENVGQWF